MGAPLRRVVVLGGSGAGKTTVARELARRTGLPLVDLDAHFWQPGWAMPDETAWREVQRRLAADPIWVMDGNYSSTYDERLPLADTVVVVEASRWRCAVRVLRRGWRLRGTEVAPGCPHRVDLQHLRYIWRFPRAGRLRLEAALATLGPDVRTVRLRGRRQVAAFLASVPGVAH